MLALFTDDAVFTSPLAARLMPESGGVARGKPALRDYWRLALDRVPELRFELTSGFRNQEGIDRFEVLRFRDGVVVEGHGTYPLSLG